MAKHSNEMSDDTKNKIIKLIESGHRALEIYESLNIKKCTISKFLKRLRERGNVENRLRKGRPSFLTIRRVRTLSSKKCS